MRLLWNSTLNLADLLELRRYKLYNSSSSCSEITITNLFIVGFIQRSPWIPKVLYWGRIRFWDLISHTIAMFSNYMLLQIHWTQSTQTHTLHNLFLQSISTFTHDFFAIDFCSNHAWFLESISIHSVSLHAPQILLFRFVCSVSLLAFLAFRFDDSRQHDWIRLLSA